MKRYYSDMGGLPGQTELLSSKAVFKTAYAVIPKTVMSDIVTSVLPHWTGEVDADSVANTAQLMQKYGVVKGEIDPSTLLQGG